VELTRNKTLTNRAAMQAVGRLLPWREAIRSVRVGANAFTGGQSERRDAAQKLAAGVKPRVAVVLRRHSLAARRDQCGRRPDGPIWTGLIASPVASRMEEQIVFH
jgi:hypothetical protein